MKSLQNTNPSSFSPIEISQQVIKLENLKREAETRLKELRSALMDKMVQSDVLTLKTGSYTISRAKRQTIRVNDEVDTEKRLKEMGHEVIKKIDTTYMSPVIKRNVDKLPGVSIQETEYVSIRINKKGDK